MDHSIIMGAILANELRQRRTGSFGEEDFYSKYAGTTIWERAVSVIRGMRRLRRGLMAARQAFVAAYNMQSRPPARSI